METQVNTTQGVTVRSTGVRYGLIGALISVVFFLILNVSGVDITRWYWSWIGYAITLGLVVLAHKYYKENGDGFMAYGQGVGIAFWLGLVSGIISGVFSYLYIKFIDTGFSEMIREKQIEELQRRGMSEEQIDQAMQFASMFTSAEMLFVLGLLGAIIATVLIGVIVSIFTKKNNPQPAF